MSVDRFFNRMAGDLCCIPTKAINANHRLLAFEKALEFKTVGIRNVLCHQPNRAWKRATVF
jgi:hypothetical protein